jgi:hypothetical protein
MPSGNRSYRPRRASAVATTIIVVVVVVPAVHEAGVHEPLVERAAPDEYRQGRDERRIRATPYGPVQAALHRRVDQHVPSTAPEISDGLLAISNGDRIAVGHWYPSVICIKNPNAEYDSDGPRWRKYAMTRQSARCLQWNSPNIVIGHDADATTSASSAYRRTSYEPNGM